MNQLVVDVSSDEEPVFEESKISEDDYGWLTELLETVDKKERGCDDGDADDDEVLVVGEYNPPKPKSKSVPLKCNSGGGVGADDDCVVLDGDPDKPVAAANDPVSESEDDVIVVGQTGQIACRDYPHPRHLCVKFPFGSTPHGDHCHLCHCYVCDSLAPCAHWGTGINQFDHCHATDKVGMWKNQRQLFKIGKDSAVPKLPVTPLPVTVPRNNRASLPNSVPRNQISRPAAIRVCSSTRSGIPNIIRRRRDQHSGYVQDRNGFLVRAAPQRPLGLRNHVISRDRGSYSSGFGLRHCPYNAMFKGSAIIQSSLEMNPSVYGLADNMNFVPASGYMTSTATHAMQNENSPGSLNVLADTVFESYTCPTFYSNTGCAVVNQMSSGPEMSTISTEPEASSHPIPQSNSGQRIYQTGNQSRNGSDCRSADLAAYSINSSIQSDEQPVCDIQLQHAGANYDPLINHCTSRSYGNGSIPLRHTGCEHESMLLNQPVPVASSEGFISDDLNVSSLEPSAVEGGMMYLDTEAPWNSLAHA